MLKNLKYTMASLAVLAALSACGGEQQAASAENTASAAASAGDTLQKIKDSGTIVLGYRESSIPFSYVADQPGQPVGYAHDLEMKIVDAVKKELGLPELKVRYNPITSQNRIPLTVNGTIDVECGSTTNNAERQKQVAFSVAFFEIGTRLMVGKGSDIKDFTDLKGKTVTTTAGTTSERLLKAYDESQKMGMNIISAKDHNEGFLMLQNGRAQAFMMDDVLLAGERAKSADPAKWEIVGKPMSFERYGCMLRKDDASFKTVVDNALTETYKSGEINTLYSKWFEQPIPPKGMNMQFPMSELVKSIIATPTDAAAE
ncbi:glutamate/aspartate ABC transporter substrate-binding protein [Stenoxybacter acetivorans]|uniref:glutamate/aspartate ABC transporter substrate-binding protein n=1 Tax=Stenoxybacter acetivorans TaxID=422441 RepID=UPI00055B535C|nr:glutamate/aspartate ABC transporter substrate-binding protein [Stenoxybacter acetivorans]